MEAESGKRTDGPEREKNLDFIRTIIDDDLRRGKHEAVVTRFPPEPNGYLHIGHAKAICTNFGIAADFGGRCHLRMDDTNPAKEDMEYVDSHQRDIRWLGFEWGEHLYFASDYYERLYQLAELLIEKGKAYVCSLSKDEQRQMRGTLTEPGRDSPYRERSVAENLEMFRGMRAGHYPDGAHTLRAKIDMAHPNLVMRDPTLYRIKRMSHYRVGDAWCIYPMYDFTHCLSDSFEGITHSLCSLEFENNRPLYDWVIEETGVPCQPRQIEFARLNVEYTVLSKRKLIQMVRNGTVRGWDDPRMPTLAGMRRRGVLPESIRRFVEMVGLAKTNSFVDIEKFEFCIRDDLNSRAPRVMAVLDPLKLVITNYPEGAKEELDIPYWPHDIPKEGSRAVPFGREIWIERADFEEVPPKGFRRLSPGTEVRLRYAYVVRCDEVVKDPATGRVIELRCSYDPETLGRNPEGRKVKGVIHWLSAAAALPAEVRLYERLFRVPRPDAEGDFLACLNSDSLTILAEARVEPSVASDPDDTRYQFERHGYFIRDPDSSEERLVFNRIVALRSSWEASTAAASDAGGATNMAERATEVSGSPSARAEDVVGARDGTDSEVASDGRGQRSTQEQAAVDSLVARYPLGEDDAALLLRDPSAVTLFEETVEAFAGEAELVANWFRTELFRELKGKAAAELSLDAPKLASLLELVYLEQQISLRIAKQVFAEMLQSGADPRTIVEAQGLQTVDDAALLRRQLAEVIAAFPEKVREYRAGRGALLGFFIGQVMRRTGGQADPKRLNELAQSMLADAGD